MKVVKAEPLVKGFIVTISGVEMIDRKGKPTIYFACNPEGNIIYAGRDGQGGIIESSIFKDYFSPKMIQRIRNLCKIQVNKVIHHLNTMDWERPGKGKK